MSNFKILTLTFLAGFVAISQGARAEFPQIKSCGEYRISGTVECESNGFCGVIGSKGTRSEFRLKFISNEAWHQMFNQAHIDAVIEVVQIKDPVSIIVQSFKRTAPVFEKGDEQTLLKVKKCNF